VPNPEEIEKVVDAYVDSYRRNDRAACIELFQPDAVWHDPVGEPPHVGHDGIGAFWDQAHSLADQIVLVPSQVLIGGNEAAMVMEIQITLGETKMAMDAVEVFQVGDDGKISSAKAYWDMARARPIA
jgi:steroid Delta-isomerase